MKINCLQNSSAGRNIFFTLFAAVTVLVFFSSCAVTKHSEYFATLQQKDTTLKTYADNNFETKIMKGDRLAVTASSLSTAEDALFNAAAVSSEGYLVQPDGMITLHRIGKMTAVGLTRRELSAAIEAKLLPYMKEAIVHVSYLNRKITLLGEVNKPGVLPMPDEKLSLLDAIVLSGDLTANATRKNITIIREEGDEKKVKHVNLEDNSIFSSPWYYLKPNDIVLVSGDYAKSEKAEKRAKLQTVLSLVASGISLLIIILDRVIK